MTILTVFAVVLEKFVVGLRSLGTPLSKYGKTLSKRQVFAWKSPASAERRYNSDLQIAHETEVASRAGG